MCNYFWNLFLKGLFWSEINMFCTPNYEKSSNRIVMIAFQLWRYHSVSELKYGNRNSIKQSLLPSIMVRGQRIETFISTEFERHSGRHRYQSETCYIMNLLDFNTKLENETQKLVTVPWVHWSDFNVDSHQPAMWPFSHQNLAEYHGLSAHIATNIQAADMIKEEFRIKRARAGKLVAATILAYNLRISIQEFLAKTPKKI